MPTATLAVDPGNGTDTPRRKFTGLNARVIAERYAAMTEDERDAYDDDVENGDAYRALRDEQEAACFDDEAPEPVVYEAEAPVVISIEAAAAIRHHSGHRGGGDDGDGDPDSDHGLLAAACPDSADDAPPPVLTTDAGPSDLTVEPIAAPVATPEVVTLTLPARADGASRDDAPPAIEVVGPVRMTDRQLDLWAAVLLGIADSDRTDGPLTSTPTPQALRPRGTR